MQYVFLVLFPDGRVKASRDIATAARHAAADGGEVLTVYICPPAPEAAPAEPAPAAPVVIVTPAEEKAPQLSPVPELKIVEPTPPAPAPEPARTACPTCNRTF